MIFTDTRVHRVHRRLRRLLRLPADPPSAMPFRFVPCADGGAGYTLESVPEQEFQDWHREPRRARILAATAENMEALGRLPTATRRRMEHVHGRAEARRARAELAQARSLTWTSVHVIEPGVSQDAEGYLVLPSGRRLQCDIVCISLAQRQAAEEWEEGRVCRGLFSADIVIPAAVITERWVHAAILRWCMDMHEYDQGNWALRQGALPRLDLDPECWQWPPDPEAAHAARAAVAQADGLLNAPPSEDARRKRVRERLGRFGQSPPWEDDISPGES